MIATSSTSSAPSRPPLAIATPTQERPHHATFLARSLFPYSLPLLGELRSQIMAIAQNTALFTLLSSAYGGRANHALPDCGAAPRCVSAPRRAAVHAIGQQDGTEAVVLDKATPSTNME